MRSPGVAVIAAVTACSGATVNVARSPAPAVREAPAAPTEVRTRSCESTPQAVDDTHFLLCGQRIEVRDERAVFADDETASALQWAVAVDEGWVFVTVDGFVARSDEFTGALRPLGRFAQAYPVLSRSRGRAAIVVRNELWLSDGRTLTRADVLGRPVRSVAFLDASKGAAVLLDGALAITADGGARWSPVDLGGDRALSIELDGDMRVRLALRYVTLQPDGTLAPATGPTARPEPESAARATLSAALAEQQAAFERVSLPGGAWLTPSERGLTFHDGRGFEREVALSESPLYGRQRSGNPRWGPSVAIAMTLENNLVWHRLDADGRITRIFGPGGASSIAFPEEGVVWGDDGRHMGWIGRCPAAPAARGEGDNERADEQASQDVGDDARDDDARARGPAAPSTLCVLEDGVRRWREAPLPDATSAGVRWRLAGFHGARALLQNTLEVTEYAVVDTATDATSTVRCEDPSVHIRALRWSSDGALAGVGERCADGCEFVVLRGAGGDPLSVRPSPGGEVVVDFVDADKGLALDRSFATLWRTRDGARSWEVVMTHVPHERSEGPSVACDPDGCLLGDRVRVRGWGALPTLTHDVVSGDDAPDMGAGEATAPSREVELRARPMRCEFVGASRPSPWRAAGSSMRAVWRDGVAALSTPPSGDHDATRVAWWTEGRHGVTTLPAPLRDRSEERSPFTLLAADRAVMAVTASAEPRLFWLDAQAPRVVDRAPFDAGSAWSADPSGIQIAPAADGGVALAAQLPTNPSTTLLAELDARGAVRAWRVYVRDDRAASLARREGRWGLLSSVDERGARFEPVSGDAAVTVAPWAGTMGACVGPAAADAITLYATPTDRAPAPYTEGVGSMDGWRSVLELSRGGTCLRGISAVLDRRYESERAGRERLQGRYALHLTAAAAGALEGFADDGNRRVTVRCQVRTGER